MVGKEDEVRGMSGGSTRVRHAALVEQDDVLPAEARQVKDHAVADDAGADDDDAGLRGQAAHRRAPPMRGSYVSRRARGSGGRGTGRASIDRGWDWCGNS